MNLPVVLVQLAVFVLAFATTLLLWRTRNSWPPIPGWTWIIIFKLLALAATIVGAGILTALFWYRGNLRAARLDRVIDYLANGKGGDAMGEIAKTLVAGMNLDSHLLVGGILVIVLSLGWVLTPRKFEFQGPGGFRGAFSGGEEEAHQQGMVEGAAAATAAAGKKTTEIATNPAGEQL